MPNLTGFWKTTTRPSSTIGETGMAIEPAKFEETQAFEEALAERARREIKLHKLSHAGPLHEADDPVQETLSACLAQLLELQGQRIR